MALTNFTSGTVITSDWLNRVDTMLETVVFNVKDPLFDAQGDNSTNDTAAIQAAIDAAEAVGGVVFIPEGIYRIDGLTISDTVSIRGAGKFRSILRMRGGASHGITLSAGNAAADILIEHIGLEGIYPTNPTGHGIYLPDETILSYGRGVKINHVYITQFVGNGLYVGENRNNGKAFDLEISRCNDAVYIDNSSDWKIIAGEFGVNRQFCVNIPSNGADNKFVDCSMWTSVAAVNLNSTNSSPSQFIGCTFDHHTTNGVRITGTISLVQPHVFLGCWFRDNSQAGNNLHAQILLTTTRGAIFHGCRFTDQESAPTPSYIVEFSGTCGEISWVGNVTDTAVSNYATAYTNVPNNLVLRGFKFVSESDTQLGGESGAQGLYVNPGVTGGNYVLINPAPAGRPPEISALGADTNINLRLYSKGTGSIDMYCNNLRAVRATGVASAVNYVELINSITGNAVIAQASGTDTNIDLKLVPKGSGHVQMGTHTSSSDTAVSGYIEIKDSSGTIRKLAVIS